MNERELEIFELIKENPFISQQELSESVGLSRSAVANIISGLIKKGRLKGKAYIINEDSPIVCIGAANVDRKFYISNSLIKGTSNPINSSKSVGGVARNIAENLGRLSQNVSLITVRGEDNEWETVKSFSSSFINMDHVHMLPSLSTGSYTALINDAGNMEYGFADMDIYDALTPDLLLQNSDLLKRAKCIIIDSNIPKESIEFLRSFALKHNVKIIIIPVSGPKMAHLPDNLNGIDWIVVNKDETETFFNLKITSDFEGEKAAFMWNKAGVKNVIVTNGLEPLVYTNGREAKCYPVTPSKNVVDVTGAGDAFASAVVYGWLLDKSVNEIINLALINSKKTIETKYTVRHDLDEEELLNNLEEI